MGEKVHVQKQRLQILYTLILVTLKQYGPHKYVRGHTSKLEVHTGEMETDQEMEMEKRRGEE